MLRIYLLGAFQVEKDGRVFSGEEWRGRQMRTVLKMLALRAGQVIPADQFIEQLWPDEDPQVARRYLHVRMSQLRRTLSPEEPTAHILTKEGGYFFRNDRNSWIDVHEFQAAGEQGRAYQEAADLVTAIARYESAHRLYRGDFLEEDLYEDCTIGERERLQEQHLDILTRLAERYAQGGRYHKAIELCRLVLDQDTCRESVYVRLMLYHYYAGEQDQAIHAYEKCAQTLARELEVQPLPETVILAEQIRSGRLWAVDEAPRYPSPIFEGRLFAIPFSLGHAPLAGREQEYAWLIERWQSLGSGIILIEGEAGVGKTRLASEFLGYAESQGATCLRAQGRREQPLAYAVLIQALSNFPGSWEDLQLADSTLSTLALIFTDLRARHPILELSPKPPAEQEQERIFKALEQVIQTRFPQGVILFVDDAQLVDAASLELLMRLAAQITILLACRSEETPPDHPLRQLAQLNKKFARLNLACLERQQVMQLIRKLSGVDQPDLVVQLMEHTDGNPLFILSWLGLLFESGYCYVDSGGQWRTTSSSFPPAPESLEEVLQTRLKRLSPPQQRVMDLAAVSGSSLSYSLLEKASGLQSPELMDVVDSLIETGLLVEPRQAGHGDLALGHAYFGATAYASIPDLRRRNLHGDVANAIVDTSPDLDSVAPCLAHHFQQAGDRQSAFTWLVRAAQVAETRYAYEQSLTYYKQAADFQISEAGSLFESMGRLAYYQAHYADSLRYFNRALAYREAQNDLAGQVEIYYALAECQREQSQFVQAAASAQRGLDLVSSLGQPTLEARGMIVLSNALRSGQLAPTDTIRQYLLKALEISQPLSNLQVTGEACFWLGVLAINAGDPDTALQFDKQALECFRQIGQPGWLAIAHNNQAYHALLAGQNELALQSVQVGLELARPIGILHTLGWLLSTLGEILIHGGKPVEARQALEEGLALVEAWGPLRLQPGLLLDLARCDMAEGMWLQARERLSLALQMAEQTAPQFVPRVHLRLAQALLGNGEAAQALAHAQAAEAGARAKGQNSVIGQAWRLLGEIYQALGQADQIEISLNLSVHWLERSNDRLELARTRAAISTWLERQGKMNRPGKCARRPAWYLQKWGQQLIWLPYNRPKYFTRVVTNL